MIITQVSLKEARLDRLKTQPAFTFIHADLQDRPALEALFTENNLMPLSILLHKRECAIRWKIPTPISTVTLSGLPIFWNAAVTTR